MAITAVSDLNGLYNTIYERALFVAREMNLMGALVDNRSASGWMSRKVPIRPAITAVTVAETDDFSSPTTFGKTSLATLTPSEIIAQVLLTDQDMETDPDSATGDATMELGGAIATKIDVDLVTLFASFATDIGDGAGAAATLSNISAGVAILRNAHAMQYGEVNIVLHPYHWHDIWVELGQPSTNIVASDAANEALRAYTVNRMLGATWMTSSNISIDASDDAVSGMFVRPALMLDTRRAPRLEVERDASARATELNMTAGYAVGIVRDTFGLGFTADATTPA
jgi:hypothetical protein